MMPADMATDDWGVRTEAQVAEALSQALSRRVRFHHRTGSTNADARQMAEAGAPSGSLCVADEQLGGRGRRGRTWWSPPGKNLYFSLIWRPGISLARTPLLGLAAAVALAQVLSLRIKWPNDLVDDGGRKVAGLLSEMEVAHGAPEFVILGWGVNVNQQQFPSHLPNASSLSLLQGRLLQRQDLLRTILPALEDWLRRVERRPQQVLGAWEQRCATLGRLVRVHVGDPAQAPSPDTVIEGVAVGLRGDGALLLRDERGVEIPLLTGDVLP